ncbi:MAG: O-succinylbenzoate synthase [Chloroflexi bacterium]|nr:MAG: O-succinylbenzoate synthase [Chloroflexota bacterium]
MRRIAFAVRLRVPVMGVRERNGWIIEGAAGWGECSPLPTWSGAECAAAEGAAVEAAELPFPQQRRDQVLVNALVPRLAPDAAAQLAVASRCATIKVKVGDSDSVDRVAAVRVACGRLARIRVDANGSWDADTAERELKRLSAYGIELAEDPVATLEELARLRRRTSIPLAAESCIRTVDDATRLRELAAADVVVLKPQRIGGVRAALRAAESAGVPAIASSALETSVGLAAVVALAAALPDAPFAHGAGTALLLESDIAAEPLLPVDGCLPPRRVTPDPAILAAA